MPPSYFTIDNHMHYLYQEGRTVFKYAVSNMSDISAAIAEKNNLTKDTIDWVIPHQPICVLLMLWRIAWKFLMKKC